MKNLFIKLLITLLIMCLKSNLLIREEHEVINKNLRSLFQCILWTNGAISCNFKYELIIVGLLLNTIWFNSVLYVTNRGVDGIDWENVNVSAELTILISRNITASLINSQIDLHRSFGI